jgi:lipid II:glycine glycyltransferase (peptidoglycan interpeptide bridge formation enzyme)
MKIVTPDDNWNADVLKAGGGFLQAREWGNFQKTAGLEVRWLRDEKNVPSLWLKRPLPLGRHYWYCPRGPISAGVVSAGGPVAATEAARLPLRPFRPPPLAKGGLKVDVSFQGCEGSPVGEASVAAAGTTALSGADFLRIEPQAVPFGALRVSSVQPSQTWILDLAPDAADLMKGMHPKTRYNIGLAERKGVRTYRVSLKDPNVFDIFWSLVGETTGRDRFSAHDREYYRQMLETLAGDPAHDAQIRPVATLEFAEHDGRVLAANLMIWFGDTVTYLHGASSNVRREVMAPHLMHWKLINEAKSLGFKHYDFWGVAPEGAVNHPWAGVSRFKRGFGGRYVSYPGTFDLPLDRFWYRFYRLIQSLRGRN